MSELDVFATDDPEAARAALHRIPVHSRDEAGRTPLQVAAAHGSPEVVAVVLLASAYPNPNTPDHQGRTALLLAVENDAPPEVVALLRRVGADARHADRAGRTPESVARERGSDVFADLAGPAPVIGRGGHAPGYQIGLLVDGRPLTIPNELVDRGFVASPAEATWADGSRADVTTVQHLMDHLRNAGTTRFD